MTTQPDLGVLEAKIDPAETLRTVTGRLLPFLFLLYIVAYIDRVNVSFAKLGMDNDLRFSAPVYGTGAGIFFIGYCLFEVPSNLVLERVGARRWICRIMLTWGVVAMCMATIHSVASFYVLRFLLGIAEAGFFPGIILYLTYWYRAADRARIIGTLMTATALAFVVGAPLSTWILGFHIGGLAGWKWLFILEGLPAIVLGFVVLVRLPDGPASAPWLNPEQRAWVAERARSEDRPSHDRATFLNALTNPRVYQLTLLYFAINTGNYGISLWLPTLVKEIAGGSNMRTGVLTAVPQLAGAVCMVLNGIHSDRTRERRLHVAIPALVGVLGLVMSTVAHDPTSRFMWIVLANAGMSSLLGPFWTLPPSCLTRVEAAAGIAFINSIGNLGGYVGPALVGHIIPEFGMNGAIRALSLATFTAAMVALTVPKHPQWQRS